MKNIGEYGKNFFQGVAVFILNKDKKLTKVGCVVFILF
jgi:hypothetical protein